MKEKPKVTWDSIRVKLFIHHGGNKPIRTIMVMPIHKEISCFLFIGHPKDCNADSHPKENSISHPEGHSADKASESEVPCFAFPIRLFGFVFALFHVFARILVRLRYALHNQSEILRAKAAQQLVDNKKNLPSLKTNYPYMRSRMLAQNNNLHTNHNLQKLYIKLRCNRFSFSFLSVKGRWAIGFCLQEETPIADA